MFVVSWVNPDKRYADKTFEDYMFEGPLAALDAIEKATGEKEVNVIGYCLGGTLLGCDARLHGGEEGQAHRLGDLLRPRCSISRTPASSACSSTRSRSANLEKRMNEHGYLEGSEMATTFNMLRANDLIWSFVVNNYLLGKDPFPFDLLYWNSDSTRMPATMHSFYLRNMYLKNALKEPGGITLDGVPIDLRKIKLPAYFISTAEDHIAPWKSTYLGARRCPARCGSCSAAPATSPASSIRRRPTSTATGPSDKLAADAGSWLEPAELHGARGGPTGRRGSTANAGERVPARVPGKGKLKIIEDAPGSYVSMRAGAG